MATESAARMAAQHAADNAPSDRNSRTTKPTLFDTAWSAAEDILNPTIVELKDSARKLVIDMCQLAE